MWIIYPYFKHSMCPLAAAFMHIFSFISHPILCKNFKQSTCPDHAAVTQTNVDLGRINWWELSREEKVAEEEE